MRRVGSLRRHPINGYRLFDTEEVLRLRDEITGTRKAS